MQYFVKNNVFYVYTELTPRYIRKERREDFNFSDKKHYGLLYNYHHIIPLSIGGTNRKENIILMLRTEHELLHKFIIDPQIKSMIPGKKKRIMLPVMNGEFFSLLSDEFKCFLRQFEKNRH